MIATFISEIKLSQTQRKEIFQKFDFQPKFLRLETSEETENKKYSFCVLSLKNYVVSLVIKRILKIKLQIK
jgi:hypothetical protein